MRKQFTIRRLKDVRDEQEAFKKEAWITVCICLVIVIVVSLLSKVHAEAPKNDSKAVSSVHVAAHEKSVVNKEISPKQSPKTAKIAQNVHAERAPEKRQSSPVYVWPNQPVYKEDRLAFYQNLLQQRGVTDPKELKLLTAQLIIENGSLSEDVDGDHGCSVGIPQRNVCQFGYTAKSFRKKYPAWNTYQTQLTWMADQIVAKIKKYGDLRLAVISHNSPRAAARGQDSCGIQPCYYTRVLNASKLLTQS